MLKHGVPGSRFGLLCMTVLLGTTAGSLHAEFTVGSEVPSFSLRTPDGEKVDVNRVSGELQVVRNGKGENPKLLAVHILQPDCLQCRAQLKALRELDGLYRERGLLVLGISHRGDGKALAALGEDLRITFPLLMGTGSEPAKRFASGDTFGLIDRQGVVRFAQVGFGAGDEKVWTENIEAMLAGKPPVKERIERERLKTGDRFPAVALPSLWSGKPMELAGKGDKLVFRSDEGKESPLKAAIGFFSRYWTFSREEMVHLQKFHERYGKDGLQVFVISMHPDPEEARRLTKELGVTYPVFDGRDADLGKQYAYG